ncbi:MAG: hypothetical protein HQL91_11130 [Magnetococcales bacterium]|nr:hypothetical protein [Magnetococcales bacterium]
METLLSALRMADAASLQEGIGSIPDEVPQGRSWSLLMDRSSLLKATGRVAESQHAIERMQQCLGQLAMNRCPRRRYDASGLAALLQSNRETMQDTNSGIRIPQPCRHGTLFG